MSTQMEFIMQLYMMNLMQQQQQQQQLLQQQQQQQLQLEQLSPSKDIATTMITSSTTPPPRANATADSKHKPRKSRTQKRAHSQNTNCSSSSSCSPNSNASFHPINHPLSLSQATAPHLHAHHQHPHAALALAHSLSLSQMTQMPLLSNMAASSMSHPSLLLTPTTPGSLGAPLDATTMAGSPTHVDGATHVAGDIGFASCGGSGGRSLANNFLQSSTVTSTPTEKSPAPQDLHLSSSSTTTSITTNSSSSASCVVVKRERRCDDGDSDGVNDEGEEEEDEQPVSSILSSSGEAMCSGVPGLESTDSLDSPNMPYTPIKQPADSSFSGFGLGAVISSSQSTTTTTTTMMNEEVSPLSLAKAILTPPSSEQLLANTTSFEAPTQTQIQTQIPTQNQIQTVSTAGALTTASSLDAFLQNEENLKNLRKFSSYLECENALCRQENLREHFHCFDEPCQGKILSKKDDIIRHLKWHKKRRESLRLGFARFSASDDCEPSYGAGCAYNWKQTHYHCVYEECPKVYVSTSDVQMHANFHRKNSEIVQEGFRRFRAHENCKIEDCPFFGKRISHYHCCREGCQHTFKNKADMDKHKSYHMKDLQLSQDGFKKILKTEVCPFDECKFSSVCNHIHCVRENCNYILHSSSQMISHKRKHDRLDGEQAYQSYKKQQQQQVQKDSSEEESPKAAPTLSHASTPLSSLSADHFLARKRGRPPKKIELPADADNAKRFKTDPDSLNSNSNSNPLPGLFPQFLPGFNPAVAAAAAAASAQSQDAGSNATAATGAAPNFQLTHLMALFQLQNPLFYQNLYPGGMAANVAANLMAAGAMPQNPILGNLAAFSAAAAAAAASATNIKSEFGEKPQFKE